MISEKARTRYCPRGHDTRETGRYRQGQCKVCQRDAARAHSRKKVGIVGATDEQREGVCVICGRTRKLHLDHDHTTGRIRGWPCLNCNTKLGWYEKNSAAIKEYLCDP